MFILMTILACNDVQLTKIEEGMIWTVPDVVDFGSLESGLESRNEEVWLVNGSTEQISLNGLVIDDTKFSAASTIDKLEPDEWGLIQVSYTPLSFEENEGTLDIYLEGSNTPSFGVSLLGKGDAPLINVEPLDIHFGEDSLGCTSEVEAIIENGGNLNLIIQEPLVMTSDASQLFIDFGSLSFPVTLIPGQRITSFVKFNPSNVGQNIMQIQIDSNDPANGTVIVNGEGKGVEPVRVNDIWTSHSITKIDIVWVIDNSGSMARAQTLLSTNMLSFMNIFLSFPSDFRMMFITTDEHLPVNGVIIDNNTPNASALASNTIDSIGTAGSAMEAGLESLWLLVNNNPEYLREDAILIPIFVSDEDDFSPFPWSFYSSEFYNFKGPAFAPYGIIGDNPYGCTNNSTGVFALPGWSYSFLINEWNKKWWSICNEDWGSGMVDVANEIVLNSSYRLSSDNVDSSTILVWVNGQEVFECWTYNETINSVVFDLGCVPGEGDTVEISYYSKECY